LSGFVTIFRKFRSGNARMKKTTVASNSPSATFGFVQTR
jgi:hypothetical protein